MMYEVTDVMTGNVILAGVTSDVVMEKLRISKSTLASCVSEDDRLCRRMYRIRANRDEDTKMPTLMPDDFRQQWLEMQRLFGITPEEDYEAEF